jgi:hypothetical protein
MNTTSHRMIALTAMLVTNAVFASRSIADPLPGEDLLKFSQKPMNQTQITNTAGVQNTYYGHDELSTAYGLGTAAAPPTDYQGTFMADDFSDNLTSPVVHVKWWGSYHVTPGVISNPVQKFLIAFESDVPVNSANTFSHPGSVLQYDVVNAGALAPGSGTFTEKLIRGPDPILNESLYEYNAELHLNNRFLEQKDTVYWLKIAALVDLPPNTPVPPPPIFPQWGWHNRDYTIQDTLASPVPSPGEHIDGQVDGQNIWHFQDDAVGGNLRFLPNNPVGGQIFQTGLAPTNYVDFADGPGPGPNGGGIGVHSKDLSFELYTFVPEPASCLLMTIGLAAFASVRRRSRVA